MSPLIVYLSKVAFLVKPERLRLALLLPLYLMSATLDLLSWFAAQSCDSYSLSE